MIPRDSIDYYPTPDSLAFDLAYSALPSNEWGRVKRYPGPILEPSAGSGSLAFAIERVCNIHRNKSGNFVGPCGATNKNPHLAQKDRSLDLDVIEISSDFRAILKDKGLRVVHDDFLSFRPIKKYWAIIMNPPFSQGAAHLLKALDIQKDGGLVRCILNAETIRNPCTNERRELVSRLEKLGAKITYKKDAFSDGLRRTNVEVAIVSVDIPEREPVSRIRLDLKREMTERLSQNAELAALVSSDPITAAIERYNAAAEGLRRLYTEFDGIKSLLVPTDSKEFSGDSAVKLDKPYNEAIRVLRRMYWRTLFDLPAIRDNLTASMFYEYQTRLDELADYDFTPYNILTIREEISKNILSGIESEIIKLFDDWTNLHYSEYSKNIHYFNGWCTNEAYKVGKRVIFNCDAYSRWSCRFDPEYTVRDTLENIEMVLFHLDTNGVPYNSTKLRDTLKAAAAAGQTTKIQLRYFTATFYKKGTCHIEFTNEDVLKSFNLLACQRKGWLPPTYGKKWYHDMSAAERQVVDDYEGEASYNDSMARGLIPTNATLLRLPAAPSQS